MSNRYESELSAFQDEVWASLEKYSRKLGWGCLEFSLKTGFCSIML